MCIRDRPNIYGTVAEDGAKIDLATQGLTPGTFGSSIPLPTAVGPFHYYSALANLSEELSMTSLYNLRQSQASADAAQMSAHDARELIILAVSGTYLRVLASKANVLSQEAQVKQAGATFKQSEHPVSYTHLDVYKRQVKRGRSTASEARPRCRKGSSKP